MVTNKKVTCGLCNTLSTRIIRFSASMSLRPFDNPQSHQIISKLISESLADSAPLSTPLGKSLTSREQANLRDLLIHAIYARDINSVMHLLIAGANGADGNVLGKSIFCLTDIQCENNIFDLMLAQVLADLQKVEKVNWKKLMNVAVGNKNEHCIKRLAPLCAVKTHKRRMVELIK